MSSVKFPSAKERRLIGWDDSRRRSRADATVMSLRGVDGALPRRGRSRHGVAAWPTLYLDTGKALDPRSRGTRSAVSPEDVTASTRRRPVSPERRHCARHPYQPLTEHVRTEERAAWMTWPRRGHRGDRLVTAERID
jgi:hexosaminidase